MGARGGGGKAVARSNQLSPFTSLPVAGRCFPLTLWSIYRVEGPNHSRSWMLRAEAERAGCPAGVLASRRLWVPHWPVMGAQEKEVSQ